MKILDLTTSLNNMYEEITKELDISPSKYRQAVQRYESVAKCLLNGEYEGVVGILNIYPQGSFRLGTVVRPYRNGKDADYDIDLVCVLPVLKGETTAEVLKKLIGDCLRKNKVYSEMLDKEGRRCWTLLYAEQDGTGFHLDVLPAVNEEKDIRSELSRLGVASRFTQNSIAITNKTEAGYEWCGSNPKGYAEWFESINKESFDLVKGFQKKLILEGHRSVFNSIDEVPDALVKTPLQRAIQILKRHRDVRFSNHILEKDKPISMIITTLAARMYNGEQDIFSTLANIVDKLQLISQLLKPEYLTNESFQKSIQKELQDLPFIRRLSDGTWLIPNPVNPSENFADRWKDNENRKAQAFFGWVKWVKEDLLDIINRQQNSIVPLLELSLGKDVVTRSTRGLIPTGLATNYVAAASAPSPTNVTLVNYNKPWRTK